MRRFQIVEGFGRSQVQIVRGSKLIKIDLDKATAGQLKMLHDIGHPAVQEIPKEPEPKAKNVKE